MVFADDGTFWLTIGDQYRFDDGPGHRRHARGRRAAPDSGRHRDPDGSVTCPAGSHLPIRTFQSIGGPDETSGQLYCIPDDNPWLSPSGAAFEEYATIGHRNPHRLAKDPVTGRLWSGEVGESAREEINVLELGRNYGWPFREGKIAAPFAEPPPSDPRRPHRPRDRLRPLPSGGASSAATSTRGTRFPELEGRYLAGDWATRKIWAITLDEATMTATATELADFYPGSLGTFGQDKDGEVYLASVGGDGPLYTLDRITVAVPDPPRSSRSSAPSARSRRSRPRTSSCPTALNEPFWSDGARKSRWIALPNDGVRDTPAEQVAYAPSSDWSFPNGTVLMKHFELPVDETDPALTERLETRFMVRGDDARWYGLTYRWLADQSDAQLLTDGRDGRLRGGARGRRHARPELALPVAQPVPLLPQRRHERRSSACAPTS